MEERIHRGDIYMVDLGKGSGSIQGGLRPRLIVSNNVGNYYAPVVMVAPMTTKSKHGIPTHVSAGIETGIPRESTILYEQLMTINKTQLESCVGHKRMNATDDRAIAIALGLNGFGG